MLRFTVYLLTWISIGMVGAFVADLWRRPDRSLHMGRVFVLVYFLPPVLMTVVAPVLLELLE